MNKVVRLVPNPRFFGPVSHELATTLSDRVLCDPNFPSLLEQFARGEIDAQQLAYEIECAFEAEEERELNPANHADGCFEAKNQREESMS